MLFMKTCLSLLQGFSQCGDFSSPPNSHCLAHLMQAKHASPHTPVLSLLLGRAAMHLF